MTYLPATTSDFVSNATTSTKEAVTGATVPAPASRVIAFEFDGVFTVAATTTGVGFGIDIPSGSLVGACRVQISTSAGTDAVWEGMLTTDDTFNIPTDIAATAGNLFRVHGVVVTGTTAGSIQLRVDTDAAAAVTVKKGVGRWYEDRSPHTSTASA